MRNDNMAQMTNKRYSKLVDKKSPPTKTVKNCVFAFLIGGVICLLGQILNNIYMYSGLTVEQAKMAVPVTLIFLACIATGLRIFDKIAAVAGAGTLVPITGFANAILAPAIEFKAEGHVMGIGAKMFSVAGPVIVFGLTSGVVYGVILAIFRVI